MTRGRPDGGAPPGSGGGGRTSRAAHAAGPLAVFLLLALPSAQPAQERPEPCTYDACALRVEPRGIFSRQTVVRGVAGIEVARRDRSQELVRLFQGHDSAASYYAEFTVHDRRADWLSRLSTGLILASVGVAIASRDAEAWGIGLEVGGIVVGFGASFPRSAANRAFANALWWYNRSLVPEPGRSPTGGR